MVILSFKRVIITVLFILSIRSYATSYRINDIYLEGLKRTKEATVLSIIKIEIGDEISEDDIPAIKQRLLKAEIFVNSIEINIEPVGDYLANLRIKLEDKWTLIPVPVAVITSSSYLLGGVFIESNLFGYQHSLVSGLFYNGKKINGFFAWSLPEGSIGNFSLSLSYSNGETEYYNFYQDEVEVEKSDKIGVRLGYNRDFYKDFNFSTSFKEQYISGEFHSTFNFAIKYDTTEILPYFKEGVITEVIYDGFLDKDSIRITNSLVANFSFSKTVNNNLIYMQGSTGRSFDKTENPILYGGQKGSRLFKTNSIKVEDYCNGLIDFEYKVTDFSWGYLAIPIYYEAGLFSQRYESKTYGYHGPGLGVLLYLKKIAFPALGLNFTFDSISHQYNFSVAMGLSI